MADASERIAADPASPQHDHVIAHRAALAAGEVQEPVPLSRLAFELVLCMCSPIPHVEDVSFTENWIMVRRGAADPDAVELRLEDLYTDPLAMVMAH